MGSIPAGGWEMFFSKNFHCVLIIYFHFHSTRWLAGSIHVVTFNNYGELKHTCTCNRTLNF